MITAGLIWRGLFPKGGLFCTGWRQKWHGCDGPCILLSSSDPQPPSPKQQGLQPCHHHHHPTASAACHALLTSSATQLRSCSKLPSILPDHHGCWTGRSTVSAQGSVRDRVGIVQLRQQLLSWNGYLKLMMRMKSYLCAKICSCVCSQ